VSSAGGFKGGVDRGGDGARTLDASLSPCGSTTTHGDGSAEGRRTSRNARCEVVVVIVVVEVTFVVGRNGESSAICAFRPSAATLAVDRIF